MAAERVCIFRPGLQVFDLTVRSVHQTGMIGQALAGRVIIQQYLVRHGCTG